MKSFVKVVLPLKTDTKWYGYLQQNLRGIPVHWQNRRNFHITLAFMNTQRFDMNILCQCLARYLYEQGMKRLSFDCIDVFTTQSGKEHIIYLTASHVSDDFARWVKNMRLMLSENNAIMTTDFKLHVTLGRVKVQDAKEFQLRNRIKKIHVPLFTIPLQNFYFNDFDTHHTFGKWKVIS